MRLLTNDEMFAVSGGSINGQDDPTSLAARGGGNPRPSGGSGGSRESTQSIITTVAQNCKDGSWKWQGRGYKASLSDGSVESTAPVAECDRSGNDKGDEKEGGDDGGDD